MIHPGFLGGDIGYQILQRVGRHTARDHAPEVGFPVSGSRLQRLFGPAIWGEIRERDVLDFGCGAGAESIEAAQRGARRVVGVDLRQSVIAAASRAARAAGVSARCSFALQTSGAFDVVLSIDGFEHYSDPAHVLRLMWDRLRPGGKVYIAFGPPWLHPMGGHLFSVFPWAHLLFTEETLLRWRSGFHSDGARHFSEVDGGLNGMTVGRFRRLVAESDFECEHLELVPIERLHALFNPVTQELLTSVVRCVLVRRGPGDGPDRRFTGSI